MRVVIAVMPDGERLYPGPFGHSPYFAIYEKRDDAFERTALLENPYAREEGGQKGQKLMRLFGPADLWVGARFGHGPHHGHAHHGPPVPHRAVAAGRVEEALKEL